MNNRTLQRDANNIIDKLIETIETLEYINKDLEKQIEFLEDKLEEANDSLKSIKDL